ncbi:hypothetical protein KUTeg_024946 [Tegillarca granosa]|uniref:G-protein coupled receptors family 1 profile domain-containing protein n=1 Tax=Tegillarca granosa TaxID=220873 RepID=A0ABQ9DZS7_TEGGR|nr:hypothetical protein KUTeg_024946 [Tegillarca granosa]
MYVYLTIANKTKYMSRNNIGNGDCVSVNATNSIELNLYSPAYIFHLWSLIPCYCQSHQFREIICETKPQKPIVSADKPLNFTRAEVDVKQLSVRQEELFTCQSTDIILYIHRCDGINDCHDGSDEKNCDSSTDGICPLTMFQCGNNLCIPIALRCNFKRDCADGSDEHECVYPDCPEGTWRCSNGKCIDLEDVCDGPMLHRRQCYLSRSYGPQTVLKSRECDGFPDCIDGTEEIIYSGACEQPAYYISCYRARFGERKIPKHYNYFFRIRQLEAVYCKCKTGKWYKENQKCLLSINKHGDPKGCRDLTHLEKCDNFECPANYAKCPNSFCIDISLLCDGNKHCPNGEDEIGCDNFVCSGYYKCRGEQKCLPLNRVCDSHKDCAEGDDEIMCYNTPSSCESRGLIVSCGTGIFNSSSFPLNIQFLNLSYVPLSDQTLRELFRFEFLSTALLSNASITSLVDFNDGYSIFNSSLYNLLYLDLSRNLIREIFPNAFKSFFNLHTLLLDKNMFLHSIVPGAFDGLQHLKVLSLTQTALQSFLEGTFNPLISLRNLNISISPLNNIHLKPFKHLKSLLELDFRHTDLRVHREFYSGTQRLQKIYSSSYAFCCFKPSTVSNQNCFSPQDEISDCFNLISSNILRAFLWLIGITASLGNFAVVLYRLVLSKKKQTSVFVNNLGIADFLMGIYMLIIASADTVFRDEYVWREYDWKNSIFCKIAGIIATVSCESSVFFISLITLERLILFRNILGEKIISIKRAIILSLFAWILSVLLAVLPLYLYPGWYSMSGVCIALPLTSKRGPGWEYSFGIFLGLNGTLFILLSIGQRLIYSYISSSAQKIRSTQQRKEQTVATLLLLVVTTDFLCWIPVAVIGIIALSGTEIPGNVYAFIMIFVLPINSAINPFLYTFGIFCKEKVKEKKTIHKKNSFTIIDSTNAVIEILNSRVITSHYDTEGTRLDKTDRKLNIKDGYIISVKIAKALQLLHKNHIAHGSLSSESVNIIISEQSKTGNTLLSDYLKAISFRDVLYGLSARLITGKKLSLTELDATEDIMKFGHLLRYILTRINSKLTIRESIANETVIPDTANVVHDVFYRVPDSANVVHIEEKKTKEINLGLMKREFYGI